MGLLTSREVILAKTEVTYNTDPTPTAGSNAILVRNPQMSAQGLRMADRAAVRSSIGKLQGIYGGELRRLTFQCEVKGSGSAGTAPEIGPLLRSCAMAETVVASTSVTYKPNSGTSTAHESITLYYYEGGRKKHILTGCRGNVTASVEAGGILLLDFEFIGHYTQAVDATQPSPTYSSQVPKAALGLTCTINGVSGLAPRSWSFGLNNSIATPGDLTASDGYGEIIVTGRDVKGQVVIQSQLDSTIDIDALLAAGTKFALALGAIGGTAGNIITVSTPSSSTYITDSKHGEGEGLRLRTVEMAVDDSTSDQEISLAFT